MSIGINQQASPVDPVELKQMYQDAYETLLKDKGDLGLNDLKTKLNISDEQVSADHMTYTGDNLRTSDNEEAMSLVAFVHQRLGSRLKLILIVTFVLLYSAYFMAAILMSYQDNYQQVQDIMVLVYLTIGVSALFIVPYIKGKITGFKQIRVIVTVSSFFNKHSTAFKWLIFICLLLAVAAIIWTSAVNRPQNLVSLSGWFILLLILVLCSHAPRKITWRPVIGGFLLQFFMATLVLKWNLGFKVFEMLGDLFTKFMNYSSYGALFVFGSTQEHFFAFQVLPVIIFFSSIITIMYYLGFMQLVIDKLAWVMKCTVGTTGVESLCAAGNIFVGATEAPIMIRPFLAEMTNSELHAVMVSGFATIAGGVMAAYIMNGIPAAYLITASVMNAPGSLAVSKVMYPELHKSKIAIIKGITHEKQPYNNILHAAAAGASGAISLVANVAANLIAFVSLLYIANSIVSWFGAYLCQPELNFEMICGYILQPLMFTIGIEWKDTGHVAKLIGIKTFMNEFVAYNKLSEMMKTRTQCLQGNIISVRSEIITTFALCGFANFGCIGVQLGGLGPMAPSRLGDMTRMAVSAMFSGVVTNLMTACLAGLLINEISDGMSTCINMTNVIANSTYLIANSTNVIANSTNVIANSTNVIANSTGYMINQGLNSILSNSTNLF